MSYIQKIQQAGSNFSSRLGSIQKGISSLLSNSRSVKSTTIDQSSETSKTGNVYADYGAVAQTTHAIINNNNENIGNGSSYRERASTFWNHIKPINRDTSSSYEYVADNSFASQAPTSIRPNIDVDTDTSFKLRAKELWSHFKPQSTEEETETFEAADYFSESQPASAIRTDDVDMKVSYREKASGIWSQFRQHLNNFPLGLISKT